MSVDAYVAMGSNLGDRAGYLDYAKKQLNETSGIEVIVCSPVYETDPVGPAPQAPYLNAVLRISTRLSPRELLVRLQEIERECGRVRSEVRNQARTLDLDILFYADVCLDEAELTIPHPRLAERAFVLEPLRVIAGELLHPTLGERVAELAQRVADAKAVRVWSGEPRES